MLVGVFALQISVAAQFDQESCRKMVCSKHGKCVAGIAAAGEEFYQCECDAGYFGQRCYMTAAECATSLCGGRGYCNSNLTCVCEQGFSAVGDCQFCLHGMIEVDGKCVATDCTTFDKQYQVCGGRGYCRNNRCYCFDGYDIQSHCTKCQSGYSRIGNDCIHQNCYTQGETVCNLRGQCFSGICICDANANASENCLNCNKGFSLVENTCEPDGCVADKHVCGGKGQCVDGKCVCAEGTDPATSCFYCLDKYYLIGESCIPTSCVVEGKICAENGECVAYTCECNGNFDPAAACALCLNGYSVVGGTCYLDAFINDGKLCNGKGKFSEDKCICSEGFSGPNCVSCQGEVIEREGSAKCVAAACVTDGQECFSNGYCVDGVCECKNKVNGALVSNNYDKTAKCATCRLGDVKINNTCYPEDCLHFNGSATLICGGHGKCVLAAMYCYCDEGFDARRKCRECLYDFHLIDGACVPLSCTANSLLCGGKGGCIGGTCYCPGGQTAGSMCAKCPTGFTEVNLACIPETCVTSSAQGLQACSSHGRCISGACQCDFGYAPYSLCQTCKEGFQMIKGACVQNTCVLNGSICYGHGRCSNGKCACLPNFDDALNCSQCIANYTLLGDACWSSKCVSEGRICGGNGRCIDEACVCDSNVTGSQCSSCPAGQTLVNSTCYPSACVVNKTVCSLHGLCLDGKCKCDQHFDEANKCSKCTYGFLPVGSDCLPTMCISVEGTECDGKGICIEGKCHCNNAFTEESACHFCNETVNIGDACFPQSCATGGQVCAGNGICANSACECADSSFNETAKCGSCKAEYTQYFVNDSLRCFNKKTCFIENSVMCHNHGVCIDSDGECVCQAGFDSATNCSKCLSTHQLVGELCIHADCVTNGSVCSGHGSCISQACVCSGDFSQNSKCYSCGQGFEQVGSSCVSSNCVAEEVVCYNHGSCINDGLYKCKCLSHFNQTSLCKECDSGFQLLGSECVVAKCITGNTICSNRGRCGDNVCICSEGYAGEHCNLTQDYCDAYQCSGHGKCVNEKCVCQEAYFGAKCQFSNILNCNQQQCGGLGECAGSACVCQQEHYGTNCSLSQEECNAQLCSGHGNCSNSGVCTCYEAFYGTFCNLSASDCALLYCNGKGACAANSGCACSIYNANSDCSGCKYGFSNFKNECISDNCIYDGVICSGSGTCNASSCQCIQGKFGTLCQFSAQFCRIEMCSGHGDCTALNQCVCDYDFSGLDCSGCKQGFMLYDNACVLQECVVDDTICSSSGNCTATGCKCEKSSYGSQCYYNQQYCSTIVCHSHGSCSDHQTCACNPEYAGQQCDQCAAGYRVAGGECYSEKCFQVNESLVCSGNGFCIGYSCSCDLGFYGELCQNSQAQCDLHVCNGRGVCIGSQQCKCGARFAGDSCEKCSVDYTGALCQTQKQVVNAVVGVVAACVGVVVVVFLLLLIYRQIVRRKAQHIAEEELRLRHEIEENEAKRRRSKEMREQRFPAEDRAQIKRFDIVGI